MLPGDPNVPPKGWTAATGLLVPISTVAGYAMRGDELRGRCHQRDCRRTCELDMPMLVERGFGSLPVETIKRWLRCFRPEGCALDFYEERRIGLRLSWLVDRPHVAIRFACQSCNFQRVTPPARVLAKLRAKGPGAGDDDTVEKLAKLPMAPCKACGKTDWRVDVVWANVNSSGWRAAQARAAKDQG